MNKQTAEKLVVDIGNDKTTLYGITDTCNIDTGVEAQNKAIIDHIAKEHNLSINKSTAEDIKTQFGSICPDSPAEEFINVSGLDLTSGTAKTIRISTAGIRNALQSHIVMIVDAIRDKLIHCPPEIASDIVVNGILLTGCGVSLPGLAKLISQETAIPVSVHEIRD